MEDFLTMNKNRISMRFNEQFLNESKESDSLSKAIIKAIDKIDDSMSAEDLAKGVAKVLKDEYGSQNYGPFMEVLHKELGIK